MKRINPDFEPSGKHCTSCGDELTVGRVKYSKSDKCVQCSDTQRVGVFPVISGKNTYSELQFTDAETARKLHRAQHRRGQSPGAGMKGAAKLH